MSWITCSACGINFGVPDSYEGHRRDDHKSFYCPNGHNQHFPSESDAERFQRLYNAESQKLLPLRERLAAEERAHKKAVAQLARAKKRAATGVCPCCNRTFKQLSQHMESKHKEFIQLQGIKPAKQLPERVQ